MTPATLELVATAYNIGQLPRLDLPQVAMAGRSNVGKSSLVNALAGRKRLAKTSAQPGKTRSINFYLAQPYNFFIVDLPGYGYARASHEERRAWAKTLERYLASPEGPRALALLLDCRLSPQRIDLDLAAYAASISLPLIPILTKIDKCSQKEKSLRQNEWQEILGVKPLMVSASRRVGLDKAWKALALAAGGKQPESGAPEQDGADSEPEEA